MSLLEDIFLQDEREEAQQLERIIEGDEFDNRYRSDDDSDNDSPKEDEAEEEKKRVDPNPTKEKKVIKNPRVTLNPARLTGPRGIQVIPDYFKDFKFKGKGHEKEDLDVVLKTLEHWAYRLYPRLKFEDCLKKIETLGKKRPVMVHLHKIRSDQLLSDETVVQKDSSDEEPEQVDEFDVLLQQQIEIARATPAPNSAKKYDHKPLNKTITMPKASSSPSISDEQRERMLLSRKLAEQRRLARLQASAATTSSSGDNAGAEEQPANGSSHLRHKKLNVISSGDSDSEVEAVSETVSVNIHENITRANDDDDDNMVGNAIRNIHENYTRETESFTAVDNPKNTTKDDQMVVDDGDDINTEIDVQERRNASNSSSGDQFDAQTVTEHSIETINKDNQNSKIGDGLEAAKDIMWDSDSVTIEDKENCANHANAIDDIEMV